MARILLVDDDRTLRSTLRRILLRCGHEVIDAEDGAQALDACQVEAPDLVVTDIIMPGKEGLETMIELRKSFPHLPIIAMSGGGRLNSTDYLQIALRVGATRALSKPFRAQELINVVSSVLAEKN